MSEPYLKWMHGHEDAAGFLYAYGAASQALDDLCDEDTNKSENCVTVGERFLVGIFGNPFFQQHAGALVPVMLGGLMEWDLSNALHDSKNETLRTFGYVRRESGDALIVMCAYLVAGPDWARKVAIEVAEHYHSDQESVEDWST